MYKNKHKYDNYTKKGLQKKFVVSFVFAFLLIGSFVSIYLYRNRGSNSLPNNIDQTVNYAPATAAEKKEAEDNKDRIVKMETQTKNSPSSTIEKTAVKPIITNTTGSINAYISGIFEKDGTCTAIFTKGSIQLTKTAAGFQNVSYTQCAPIALDPGYLSPGSWTVLVKYTSEKSDGSSDSQIIEVK